MRCRVARPHVALERSPRSGTADRAGSDVVRTGMAPRLVKRSETLALRDGALTIAVVADTHSAPHAATRAHLTALAPDAILHAGDIGEARVIDELAEIAPVFAVRGNIDTRAAFPDILTLDLVGRDAGGADSAEQPNEGKSERNDRRLRIYLTHIAV